MAQYAANTEVSEHKSREEIERTLVRYGAGGFSYGWKGDRAMIGFEMQGRLIRIELKMPNREDEAFTISPMGRTRTAEAAQKEYQQALRQRWRALALVVKAKLEAIDSDISTFEQEFAAHIVLPDGRTVGEWIIPQIREVYRTGEMPPMLPGLSDGVKALSPMGR